MFACPGYYSIARTTAYCANHSRRYCTLALARHGPRRWASGASPSSLISSRGRYERSVASGDVLRCIVFNSATFRGSGAGANWDYVLGGVRKRI